MTIVESGAKQLIDQFGVFVNVYQQESQEPEDSNDPIFFEDTENDTDFTEHKVRLYTSSANEIMEDYGFDSSADALMYSTDDITDEGDIVEYPKDDYRWNVKKRMTNQISTSGPYIYIYSLEAT